MISRSFLLSRISRASKGPIRWSTTHFGYEQVPKAEKEKRVHTVFANVANKYDLMNDAMSIGIHRLWKDYYVKRINPQPNFKVVDVAGGTGDIAFRILRKMQRDPKGTGDITVFDINQNMLDVGQHRAQDDPSLNVSKLSWVCGNAEQLPFEDNTFDLYTIAFGIRNCTNVDKVISEAFRVLKPNGKFTCLEFSQVNQLFKPVYDLYSFQVIPVLGQILASDYNSYKYLVESIRMFPDQEAFAEMIQSAGFTDVSYENLSLGICAVHTGLKKFRGSSASPSEFVKVGRICNVKKEGLYEPGQLFLHKVFAYRGVVVCSFNVKVQGKPKANEAIGTSEVVPYYQVLVNRADWDYMNFRPDITSYFVESSANREEKVLSVINGMDCVPHNEIIPFTSTEKDPIKHDLFPRLFEKTEDSKDDSEVHYNIRRDLHPHFTLANQRSWLAPQAVYKETTENIQVTVVPYFLGPTFSNGTQKYFWRYVVRLESLDKRPVVVRERLIKIFSLNNLHQVGGPGVDGANPRLTAQNPAFQFSSTVDLLQPKGGHMWGRFTMEREDGSTFEITMPTIALECHAETTGEQTEQSRQ